ncbi:MAG: hypothetical protein R2733_09505 [Acidimicrobiales bacterium]
MDFVACAVVRDDPPFLLIAEDQETLNWVIALQLIARIPGNDIGEGLRDRLRTALRNEQWGEAVELWMSHGTEVDVYSSFELYRASDVELAAHELDFTPLFQD